MQPTLRLLLVCALWLSNCLCTSCASMFSGTTDEVVFTSPTVADVFCNGKKLGQTPVTAKVPCSADEVTFKHPEHGERIVPLASNFRIGYLLMDLLFTPGFGLLGIIVDTSTQAWWDHPGIVNCDFSAPYDPKNQQVGEDAEEAGERDARRVLARTPEIAMADVDIPDLPDALRLIQALATSMAERVPGWTVLHAAAELGYADALAFFLASGLPADAATGTGETALHVAARRGHTACVQRLLHAGADATHTDAHSRTAEQVAVLAHHPALAERLRRAANR